MSSEDEIKSAHKKALKALEGEKRAALKKAKGTKGKKAKEELANVEKDFESKLKTLEEEFQKKLELVQGSEGGADASATQTTIGGANDVDNKERDKEDEADDGLSAKERKQLKARRKKERQKEREAQRQAQIEEETANAGPGMRQIEMEQIEKVLEPLSFEVKEVEADGHCLYRAVGGHTGQSFQDIRNLCATTLAENKAEFAPFCEFSDNVSSFEGYVEQVRSSAEWGGHLELRILSKALNRPIEVYSIQSGKSPLRIAEEGIDNDGAEPIRLSYHLNYYALGEHYNQVCPK